MHEHLLRMGGGLRFKTFQIDYAFVAAGPLGNTHLLGVTFLFGHKPQNNLALAESWYDKGRKEFRQERYTDALQDFNKALQIDPSHPQAAAMMDKTYEKLGKILPE